MFEYSITGGLDRCDTPCYWTLTLKQQIISEIHAAGLEVKKIIINSNLTEDQAFAAEASLINAFNYVNDIKLTNIVSGHHSSEALTVEEFEQINGAVELTEQDIKHHIYGY
ncbi:LEM-3-like GIY-YIG domain-containing protein [Enterococcus cecorum]|uniref:LEM-3-like GIY-YIG domain-containing protein n=1 Tax=Enterococcus cecorum TaxID=44008 RepID=UPI003F928BD6